MDLFRFTNPAAKTRMEYGTLIDDVKSKTWIERYRDAGEFTVVGDIGSGLREKMPIGSFVSHVDSEEIMIVENHEINEDRGQDPELTVTGRSFETFLDQRIVGQNRPFPTTAQVNQYEIPAWQTWDQAHSLIGRHILADFLIDDKNALPFFEVHKIASTSDEIEVRQVARGGVYSQVLSILEIDDYGIKTIRPGPWSPALDPINTVILVHPGVARPGVVFSYESGEIVSADYLWSNKKLKNCAYVAGKWVDILIDNAATASDRRMMYVDASDIDDTLDAYPSGLGLDIVRALLSARGKEKLAAQKEIALAKAEVGEAKAVYRQHYEVGDLVTVMGNYHEATTMRVTEYVEIEDENGNTGSPTLDLPKPPGED